MRAVLLLETRGFFFQSRRPPPAPQPVDHEPDSKMQRMKTSKNAIMTPTKWEEVKTGSQKKTTGAVRNNKALTHY